MIQSINKSIDEASSHLVVEAIDICRSVFVEVVGEETFVGFSS